MPHIIQPRFGRECGHVTFAHVQDVGRVEPFGRFGRERLAGAVERFNHKLRTEKPPVAERRNHHGGHGIQAETADSARNHGQFARIARQGIRHLLHNAEKIVAPAVLLPGEIAQGGDVFLGQIGGGGRRR